MAARPAPLHPTTSRLPAARRRRQLLDVAVGAFSAHGFHGTSMDDVANAAGVTKPVLYQHFGSKRDLYLALLDDVGAQLMHAIAQATAGAPSPRGQVESGFAAYFAFVDTHEPSFRLLFGGGARRDEEFAAAVRTVEQSIAATISALITSDLDEDHRAVLAMALVGLAESACRQWMEQRQLRGRSGAAPADVIARRVAELAWAGLRGVTPA